MPDTESSSFEELMTRAKEWRNTGGKNARKTALSLERALFRYRGAYSAARNNTQRAQAAQQAGVTSGMMGNFEVASDYLAHARQHAVRARNRALTASITADRAMLDIRRVSFFKKGSRAHYVRLRSVEWLLSDAMEIATKAEAERETAIIEGFAGSLLLADGNRHDAYSQLLEADVKFTNLEVGDPDARVDNLMETLVAAPRRARPWLRAQVLSLIKQTGQNRYLKQVRRIMVGGYALYRLELLCDARRYRWGKKIARGRL